MIVIVCGGRTFDDRAGMFAALDEIHMARSITMVIQGGQKRRQGGDLIGADYLAEQWAEAREIACLRVPAQWNTLGHKGAGHIRNATMLQWALKLGAEALIAAPGGPGTRDMCAKAAAVGLWVETIG